MMNGTLPYEPTQLHVDTVLTITQPAPATPIPTISFFTTEYCFTAQAADSTSQWPATYTVQEVCTGNQATWTTPTPPPNFVTTIVTCNACETPTQTIICPLDTANRTGAVSIWGNGVTATATATATATPVSNASEEIGTRTVWWAGALLTQSGSPTVHYTLPSLSGYATGAAAVVVEGGNLALISGMLLLAMGWLVWQ